MREDTNPEALDNYRSPSSADKPPAPHASPDVVWLTIDSRDRIDAVLRESGVMTPDEQLINVSRAGEGNMNLTLRVRTTEQTVIVKQSRPWVEKYPQIEAPVERILQELRFYETVSKHPKLSSHMPRLLGSCPEQYVMILQCLGEANDASSLYRQDGASEIFAKMLPDLLDWLSHLHRIENVERQVEAFANRKLRALNHQHIFVIPFAQQPALNLDEVTPGLAELARSLARQSRLQRTLRELGDLYLADHRHLIHGDFFPGSWLICGDRVRIIDPEFSYGGLPEFDLGVLLAHAQLLVTEDGSQVQQQLRAHYPDSGRTTDWRLVEQFAAVEILRRLLGVAQLPLRMDLSQKVKLINTASEQLIGQQRD